MNSNLRRIAYHEAGHAAAELVFGNSPFNVTIEPGGDQLGHSHQLYGDVFSEEGIRKEIISLYAGAEAEHLVNDDYDSIKEGAWSDDEKAEEHLERLSKTEADKRQIAADLRKETAEFIQNHRKLVDLIALELLGHVTLDLEELDYIYDIYKGEATEEELEEYRLARAGYKSV